MNRNSFKSAAEQMLNAALASFKIGRTNVLANLLCQCLLFCTVFEMRTTHYHSPNKDLAESSRLCEALSHIHVFQSLKEPWQLPACSNFYGPPPQKLPKTPPDPLMAAFQVCKSWSEGTRTHTGRIRGLFVRQDERCFLRSAYTNDSVQKNRQATRLWNKGQCGDRWSFRLSKVPLHPCR